jgi:hypothetical protein
MRRISGVSATLFVAWNLICDSVGVGTMLQITLGQGTVMSFMGNLMLGVGSPLDRKSFCGCLGDLRIYAWRCLVVWTCFRYVLALLKR